MNLLLYELSMQENNCAVINVSCRFYENFARADAIFNECTQKLRIQ